MIWLIDNLEGANGTQSCSMQILDSFFQIERESKIGIILNKSRKYLMKPHRELLEYIDNINFNLENLILKENDEIKEQYNNCLKELLKWRESHKIRGAKYLKKESQNTKINYTSSGLAVKLNEKRDVSFKNLMQEHIESTKNKKLKE